MVCSRAFTIVPPSRSRFSISNTSAPWRAAEIAAAMPAAPAPQIVTAGRGGCCSVLTSSPRSVRLALDEPRQGGQGPEVLRRDLAVADLDRERLLQIHDHAQDLQRIEQGQEVVVRPDDQRLV